MMTIGAMGITPPNPVDNPASKVNARAIIKLFWSIFKRLPKN
jgi:hypothetical protein